jgi:hypothetical protein
MNRDGEQIVGNNASASVNRLRPVEIMGRKDFLQIMIGSILPDQQFSYIGTFDNHPIGITKATEKACDRYTSQYRHALRTGLLIEEFVIAVGDLLVYASYNRGQIWCQTILNKDV